jgi:hypothetical protein
MTRWAGCAFALLSACSLLDRFNPLDRKDASRDVTRNDARSTDERSAPVNTFYKYKDEHGAWSYADTLQLVPAKFRSQAVRVDLPGERGPSPAPPSAPGAPAVQPPVQQGSPAAAPAAPQRETAPADSTGTATKDPKQAEELLRKVKDIETQAKDRAKALEDAP